MPIQTAHLIPEATGYPPRGGVPVAGEPRGHHDEFNLDLTPGEVFEKRMPYAFAEFFGSFEETGAVLYPPPQCYKYYENKAMGVWVFAGSGSV
ncbi:cobD [Symbiodinium necroappetens]|uniref:CobD protein n=1 Tax=Symbiodinium necroappetens TaxID=1628268 RepID=A0A812XPV3_9DINO|nr:cobD [Symbiodinium necroappetens]